jgi:hypothetical protein
MRKSSLLPLLLSACFLAGCERKDEPPPAPARGPAPADVPRQWLGKWLGPEGTYLEIAADGQNYQVTIRNLDGPRTFPGAPAGDHITFQRDGITESIRPGTGKETGMKWLVDKTDCLVVKPGEGYCRG